jgi:hypothetical protein
VVQEWNCWLSSIRVLHLDTKQQGHPIPGLKRLQDDHVKALTSTNICSSGLLQIFSLFPPAVQRGLGSQGQSFWQHFLSQNNSVFIRTSPQKRKLKVPSVTTLVLVLSYHPRTCISKDQGQRKGCSNTENTLEIYWRPAKMDSEKEGYYRET